MFKAVFLERAEDGSLAATLRELGDERLPEGEVVVNIQFSTLNYKDALAITGRSPVVRSFPMVPGIDFAGVVERSSDPRYQAGDAVLLNGWGVGENHWGGLAQRACVRGDWLIPVPAGLNARHAMSLGTAGYTAMLCVMALQERNVKPGDGPVLVTGANGGVGSISIALLSRLGFQVTASTGRLDEADHLKALGAAEVIHRDTLSQPGKPLQKERWAAAVDCVGSHTLVNILATLRYGAPVAACGLAQGLDLPATVVPFILRGVQLAGVDSVYVPRPRRLTAWTRLAQELPVQTLDMNTRVIGLSEAISTASDLLYGKVRGRVVVDVGSA